MTPRRRRKKTWLNTLPECFEQRVFGVFLLIASAILIVIALKGKMSGYESPILLITIPAGLAFFFSKNSFMES